MALTIVLERFKTYQDAKDYANYMKKYYKGVIQSIQYNGKDGLVYVMLNLTEKNFKKHQEDLGTAATGKF